MPGDSIVFGRTWPERSAVQMANQNSPSLPARKGEVLLRRRHAGVQPPVQSAIGRNVSCASTGCQVGIVGSL